MGFKAVTLKTHANTSKSLNESLKTQANRRKNNPRTVNAIKLVATDNENNCLLDLMFENVVLTMLNENKFIFQG